MFQFLVFIRPCALQAQQFLAARGPRKLNTVLAAVFCAAASSSAHAGRPMATDDAAVLDEGACQLETWTEHSSALNTSWLNPSCNPFGSTEFALGAAHQQDRRDSSANTALMSWQVKHLLRTYDDQQTGFAIATGGQHARASGDNETFIKGIATLPLQGENLLAHLNAGGIRQRDQRGGNYRGTWGMALDAEVSAGTRVSIETFGVTSTGTNWQLGLRRELIPDRLQLDASIGSPFGRWPQGRIVTLGLVFVTPSLKR
ncbi:hypothetical protein [Herbaspirillum sp. NPDC101397]|uniref:hypothetical protein n=1 Tax=Herbaspirillum sp. NPDC101397 TaxID=3364006 RepID=UPI00383BA6F1